MPLHATNQLLVDDLEALPLLANRFSQISLVNYDSAADSKRGTFSLVFRAYDVVEAKHVAIKFFDLSRLNDVYRLQSFRREADILSSLLNAQRCLQLIKSLGVYELSVPLATGS